MWSNLSIEAVKKYIVFRMSYKVSFETDYFFNDFVLLTFYLDFNTASYLYTDLRLAWLNYILLLNKEYTVKPRFYEHA